MLGPDYLALIEGYVQGIGGKAGAAD